MVYSDYTKRRILFFSQNYKPPAVFSPGHFGVSADIPYMWKGYRPIRLAYVQR